MPRYIYIIIILALIPLGGCGEGDYVAGRQLWHAHRLRDEKLRDPELVTPQDLDKVIAAYRKVLQDHPGWRRGGEVQLTIARLYVAKGDLAQAKEEFKKVMEEHPHDLISSVEAQASIGALYERQGEWEKAKSEYRRVAANFPHVWGDRLLLKTFEIPLHLARLYGMRGQVEGAEEAYAEAIASFRKVAEENKGNELGAVARSFIARAYMEQDKPEKARENLRALITDHPQSPQVPTALFHMGQIYQERLNLPHRAIEIYRQYLEDYPDEINAKEVQLRLGQLYAQLGDFSQSIKEFQLVLDRYPRDDNLSPLAQLAIASLYEQQGKWDQASVRYRKVMRDFPQTFHALQVPLHLAWHYQGKGKAEEAQKAFQEAIVHYERLASEHRNTPFGLAAAELLANTHFAQENWETGIKALREIIDNYPQSPRAVAALFHMAEIYQTNLHQGKQAIRIYEEIRRKYHPHQEITAPALFRIGQVHQNILNQPERAKAIYRKFLAIYLEHDLRERVKEALASIY